MKKHAVCLVFALIVSGTVHAEDMPLPFPAKDVVVQYQDRGGPDPAAYTMHYSAQLKKIHMNIVGQTDYNILDIGAKHNLVVMDVDRAYMDMALKPGTARAMLPDGASMTRAGQDTIAGIGCTVWNITLGGRPDGTVCVSEDGVLLRSHYNDGKNETTEATAVQYAAQPASLFEVPAGYEKMAVPVLPGNMGDTIRGMTGALPPGMPSAPNMPNMPADPYGQ